MKGARRYSSVPMVIFQKFDLKKKGISTHYLIPFFLLSTIVYIYNCKKNAIMIMVVENPMTMAKFAIMTKNTTNGFCDEFVCTIVMVVVNVFYDYECSHICSHIIDILT